jgi:GntR family transcriptional regulator of arabinose operon
MVAKYQQIADELRQKINLQAFKMNEAIPSEAEVQNQSEVSRHTIRQAIALLVNEGYLRKEKGSGTYVDNVFKQVAHSFEESKTIGVITTYVSDYIFPPIIRGIENTLSKNGYSLLLASTNNNYQQEKECLEKMMQKNVQGLIIEPTKSNQYNPNLALYTQLREQGIPIVMINAAYEELNIPKISVNDELGGFLATDYLMKKNHRNILLITKIDDLQGKYRMKGFIRASEENKIMFKSENIMTYTTETKNEILSQAVDQIETYHFTGVVCYNDELASELNQKLIEKNFNIPDDISIIGNDNSTLGQMGSIALTTLDHPKEGLGVDAANWILQAIKLGSIQDDIIYTPQLLERSSVKKINN